MVTIDSAWSSILKIEQLHSNLGVLSHLRRILANYNADLDQASQLIASDSGLASSVIKISNSALYSRGEKTPGLHAAIQKVGFDQILKLVAIAVSRQVFMKNLDAYGMTAEQYWFTSYFSALFCESRARSVGISADEAYLVGLLADIGKVVINELLRERSVEIHWDSSIPCDSWEKVMVGFGNSRAGAVLLEKWGFPRSIYETVAMREDPAAVEEKPLLRILDYCRSLMERNPVERPHEAWDLCEDHVIFRYGPIETVEIRSEICSAISEITRVRDSIAVL